MHATRYIGPLTGRLLWQPPQPTWRSRLLDAWYVILCLLLMAAPAGLLAELVGYLL